MSVFRRFLLVSFVLTVSSAWGQSPPLVWARAGYYGPGPIAVAPNGNYAVACINAVRVCSGLTREQLAYVNGGAQQGPLDYYPDGSALVTSDPLNIVVRNPTTLQPIATFAHGLGNSVTYMKVIKVGPTLNMFLGTLGATSKWQYINGTWTKLFTWQGPSGEFGLSPTGNFWAVSIANTVTVYNFAVPNVNSVTVLSKHACSNVDFSPSGSYLAVGTADSSSSAGATLYRTSDWSVFSTLLKGLTPALVKFSTGDQSLWICDDTGHLRYVSNLGYVGFMYWLNAYQPHRWTRSPGNVFVGEDFQDKFTFVHANNTAEKEETPQAYGVNFREDGQALYITDSGDLFARDPLTGALLGRSTLYCQSIFSSSSANRIFIDTDGNTTGAVAGLEILTSALQMVANIPTLGPKQVSGSKGPVPIHGQVFAALYNGNLGFFRASDGGILKEFSGDTYSLPVFSPDGTKCLMHIGGKVRIIRTSDFTITQTIDLGWSWGMGCWSNTTSMFYIIGNLGKVYPVSLGSNGQYSLQVGFAVPGYPPDRIFASRDGTTMFVASATRLLQYDTGNRKLLASYDRDPSVDQMDCSADNKLVAYTNSFGLFVFRNAYAGAIQSVNLNRGSVPKGGAVVCTVTLTLPAPAGGLPLQLRTGTANITPTTFNFTVPAGALKASISLTTKVSTLPGTYPIAVQNMSVPTGGTYWLRQVNLVVTN